MGYKGLGEEEKEEEEEGRRRGGKKIAGAASGSAPKGLSICIANWRSIYGHRGTVNRASLELKLITFMSGAMYHYARDLGPRVQLPVDATRSLARATSGRREYARIKHDKSCVRYIGWKINRSIDG